MEELRLNGSLCFGWSLNTNFNQFWFHQKDVYSEEIPYIIRLFSPKTGSYKKFLYTYTKWCGIVMDFSPQISTEIKLSVLPSHSKKTEAKIDFMSC